MHCHIPSCHASQDRFLPLGMFLPDATNRVLTYLPLMIYKQNPLRIRLGASFVQTSDSLVHRSNELKRRAKTFLTCCEKSLEQPQWRSPMLETRRPFWPLLFSLMKWSSGCRSLRRQQVLRGQGRTGRPISAVEVEFGLSSS